MVVMSYVDEVPTGQGLDGLAGFRIKKPGVPHSTTVLSFGNPTVFRIFPEMTKDKQEVPWRLSARTGDFSGWIKGVRLASKMGVLDRFTCFAAPKGRRSNEFGPIDFFYKNIFEAVDQDPRSFPREWEDWLKYTKSAGSKLSRPEIYALVQCAVYEHGGKKNYNVQTRKWEPKHPVILAMKKSARIALENLGNTDRSDWKGNPDDINGRYLLGDIVSLGGGSLVRVAPVADDGKVRAHYDVENMGSKIPLDANTAFENWWPWEDILEFLTEEEQIANLERCFPPAAVDYALSNTPYRESVSSEVRGAFSNSMKKGQVTGGEFGSDERHSPVSSTRRGELKGLPAPSVVPLPPLEYAQRPASSANLPSSSGESAPSYDGDLGFGSFPPSSSPIDVTFRSVDVPTASGGPSSPPPFVPSLPSPEDLSAFSQPASRPEQPVMGAPKGAGNSLTAARLREMRDKLGNPGQ